MKAKDAQRDAVEGSIATVINRISSAGYQKIKFRQLQNAVLATVAGVINRNRSIVACHIKHSVSKYNK